MEHSLRDSDFRLSNPCPWVCNTLWSFQQRFITHLTNIWAMITLSVALAAYQWCQLSLMTLWCHILHILRCSSHHRPSDPGCRELHWSHKQEADPCSYWLSDPPVMMMMMMEMMEMTMSPDHHEEDLEDWRRRESRSSGWERSPTPRRWWLPDACCYWK